MNSHMTELRQQAQQKQQSWFQQLLDQAEHKPELEVNWLQQIRTAAKNKLANAPVLNRQLEGWRYSRVEALFKNNFDQHYSNDSFINKLNIKDYLITSMESYRLVFVNGRYAASLSDSSELPEGVTLGSLHMAISLTADKFSADLQQGFTAVDMTADTDTDIDTENVFNNLNTLLFNDGVYLQIKDNIQLDRPIEIIYLNSNQSDTETSDGSMIQTRNIISLGSSASAVLIERYVHMDKGHLRDDQNKQKYFFTNVCEIKLAEAAVLKHVRLQDESRQAYHLSQLFIQQQQSSSYYSSSLAFGGVWARTDYKVDFKAEKAVCELSGLYAVGDQQLVDFHLDVLHKVPSCRSSEKFKGIIYGEGRAVFDGRILVEKHAQHTDAALTNDNLLLVKKAEINTKPQLEIYADDVKCSHGTTVGRLDQQQMFYMRSRGLAEAEAKKLLCQGFAADVIDQVEHKALHEHITNRLLHTLNSDVPG